MKFSEGEHVKFKSPDSKYKNTIFTVYGYANPGYDNLIYLMDPHNRILTTDETSVELVLETMEFEGYTSTPIFDEESQIYHGHLEGIRDLVTWEADRYEDCMESFQEAVNDYNQFLNDVKNIKHSSSGGM